MIGIQLQGGLGNQLFQYIAARGLAERLGEALRLFPPHLGRKRDLLRAFGVGPSGMEDLLAAFPSVRALVAPAWLQAAHGLIERRGFGPVLRLNFRRRFSPPWLEGGDAPAFEAYDPGFHRLGPGSWLDGLFQSAAYLPAVETARAWLTPSPQTAAQVESLIASLPDRPQAMLAMHVRRGDYLAQRDAAAGAEGWALPNAYYRRIAKARAPGQKLAIFSDDLDYVRREYADLDPWTPPRGGGAAVEMLAMGRFGTLAIANSSLSWWSAWLGEPGRTILAPRHHIGWRQGRWLPGGIETAGWTYLPAA